MLALRLPSFNDRPSGRPRPSAAAVLVLPPWAAACKGRSEDAKLGFEGWGVEEEGAAGDYGREEWAGWRGTGVLLPVPSRSLQEEPPRSQRQSYKERDFGRRAKPVEGDGRGPPRAWGLPGSGAPVRPACGPDFLFWEWRQNMATDARISLCSTHVTIKDH